MVLQGSMIDIVSERSMNILARSLLVSNAGVITLLHSISAVCTERPALKLICHWDTIQCLFPLV